MPQAKSIVLASLVKLKMKQGMAEKAVHTHGNSHLSRSCIITFI